MENNSDKNVDELEDKVQMSGFKGYLYQAKLLMLFAYRCLLKNLDFHLGTEILECNKFDDAVLKIKIGEEYHYYLVQAKHRSKASDEIVASDLFTNEDVDFGLVKYVNSWIDMKGNDLFKDGVIKNVIVCTTVNFNLEKNNFIGTSLDNAIEEIHSVDNDVLNLFNTGENGKLHRFNLEIVLPILQPLTKEYNILKLAKKLVTSLIEAKAIRHEDPSFRKYHFLLADKVINTKTKMFHEHFVCDKKYNEKFSNDEAFTTFRNHVINEVSAKTYTLGNIHEKSKKKFITSKGFGFKKKEKEQQWNTGSINITNEKFDKAGNLCEHNSSALAQKLAKCLINKEKMCKEDNIFKHYDLLLDKDVFHIKTKLFYHNFIEETKGDEISPFENKKYFGLRIFRNALKNELACHKMELKAINEFIENGKIELNLSEDFGYVDHISDEQKWPTETSRQEIEECLHKIVFATNQPDEIQLDKIIFDHIYEEFSCFDLDLITGYFFTVMLNWMKGNKFKINSNPKSDVRFISSEDIMKLFKEIKRKVKFEGPTLEYCEKITEFSISFHDSGHDDLVKKFLNSENKVLNIISTHPFLCSIKTYISIKNIFDHTEETYIFERLSSLLKSSQNYVIEGFRSKICDHLLVIENDIFEENFNSKYNIEKVSLLLIDILKQNNIKKIILVSNHDDYLSECLKVSFSENKTFEQVKDEKLNLCDLKNESQKEFLMKKVNFQGFDLRLSSVIDDSSKSFIDAEILSKIIYNKTVVIGKECSNWKSLEGWYIDRVFCQKIELEDCVLISSSNHLENYFYTVSQNETINDISISSSNEPQFDKIRRDKLSRYGIKNVHYFRNEDNTMYIDQLNETSLEFTTEIKNKLMNSFNNKIILIDAEAGMGKTTVFYHMAKMIKNNDPTLWVAHINLVDLSTGLNTIKAKIENSPNEESAQILVTDVINLILESLKLESQFQINIFKHFLNNNNKVVLLFDGFDEISPTYKNITSKIIEKLHEKTKIKQIWISTRPYDFILKDLNKEFDVTAYSLEPFTKENQIELLENIWKIDTNDKFDKNLFEIFAKEMLKIFSERTKDVSTQFLGIALHTMMIAITFKNNFEQFHNKDQIEMNMQEKDIIRQKLNLSTLYSDFLKIKYFDVFCKEKSRICLEEEANKKRAKKDYEKVFFKENRLLSLNSIFNDDELQILLKDKNIRKISKLKSEILNSGECTGIVNKIIDNKPNFVHKTYAEYFVADWFINVFDEDKSRAEEILRFFLVSILTEEHQIICSFFNSKLNNETIERMRTYNGKPVIMTECEVGLLNFTIKNGWLKLAKYLVENGVRSDFLENDGKTVMVQSAEIFCSYEEFIELYNSMENHYEDFYERLVEVPNFHNMAPIHAYNYRNYQCVRALWEKVVGNPKIKRHEKEAKLDMMLSYMNISNEYNILSFFTKHKSTQRVLEQIFIENPRCGIAMSHIIERNPNFIMFLIDIIMDMGIYGPENAIKIKNGSGQSLFDIAAEAKNDIILKYLIDRVKDHPEVLKQLFSTDDLSPIFFAVKYGHENNFKILLDLSKSLQINIDDILKCKNVENETLLHIAAKRETADNVITCLINLFSENLDIFKKTLLIKNKWGATPMYLAIRSGHKNNIQLFFNALEIYNIDIDINVLNVVEENDTCMTAFHAAALRTDDDVLICLLNHLSHNPNIIKTFLFTKDNFQMTPVLYAAQAGNKNNLKLFLEFLISNKVSIEHIMDMRGRKNDTLLHFAAARDKNDGVLKYLLVHLSEEESLLKKIIFAECDDYCTPIHNAALSYNENNIKILFEILDSNKIESKIFFSKKTSYGSTLFHIAADKIQSNILHYIMDRLKDDTELLKKVLLAQDNEGYMPIHKAAEQNSKNNFYIIFDALEKYEINVKDIFTTVIKKGETLLHILARRHKEKILTTSLDYLKHDPQTLKNLLIMNDSGYTPIHSAIANRHPKNLQIIVDVSKTVGISIEEIFSVLTGKNESIFHIAVKDYSSIVLKYLIELFKDNRELIKINSFTKDESRRTAIHNAVYEGHENNLNILLDALKLDKAEIETLFNIIDVKGKTLLHLAAERKWTYSNLTTLLDLLKNSPVLLKNLLSIKDNEGCTPIQCAASGYKTNKQILVDVLESLSSSD